MSLQDGLMSFSPAEPRLLLLARRSMKSSACRVRDVNSKVGQNHWISGPCPSSGILNTGIPDDGLKNSMV
jgi:hypothetical protein